MSRSRLMFPLFKVGSPPLKKGGQGGFASISAADGAEKSPLAPLLRRGELESDMDLRRALWLAVVIGLAADLYLPCARAGLFVRSPLGLLWPLFTALCLVGIVILAARAIPRRDFPTVALAGAIVAAFIALAVLDLVPPVARDELVYHLAMPALYLRAGHTVEVPFIIHAYYPMLMEMLYTPLLGHIAEQVPKDLHLLFALGTGALIFLYLAPRVLPGLAMLAAALVFTTPTVMALAATAYVDLGLLFFSTVGVIGLLLWSESDRRADLVVSALAAGCAAGAKYNGLIVIVLLAVAVFLAGARRSTAAGVALAGFFALLALVPLAPWLIKNVWDTGNPVFPLMNHFFGGRPLPSSPHVDVFSYRRALYQESWLEILLVPLRVFVSGREGDPARFDGVFNPIYLVGIVAVFLPATSRRHRLLGGLAITFLFLALFSTVFRSRYVVPVLTPLILVTIDALNQWWRKGPICQVLIASLAGGALLFNVTQFSMLWTRMDPLSYALGHTTRAEYISRFVPEYPVAEYANANLPADSLVYLAFLGGRGYYWEHPYLYDVFMSGTLLHDVVRRAKDGGEVADLLCQQGMTHIASVDPLLAQYVESNFEPVEQNRWLAFWRDHLHLLYSANGIGLYQLDGHCTASVPSQRDASQSRSQKSAVIGHSSTEAEVRG